MGSGRRLQVFACGHVRKVWLAATLAAALASACSSGDDKATQLNPQPEYPTRPVDPRSTSTKGGATGTSHALRGSERLSARDAVRIPGAPTPQPGGGEGGAEGDGQ